MNYIEIIIDSREPKSCLKYLINSFPNISFSVKCLEEGDYESAKVIVERKTINDLYSSIIGSKNKKGRLEGQVSRLSCHNNKMILILITGNIYNTAERLSKIHVSFNMDIIYGQIASICCRENFHILWIEDERCALTAMVKFMQKVEDGKYKIASRRDPDRLMARLFNITYDQWILVKSKYKTINNMSRLEASAFKSIQGIGVQKSKDIWVILNEQI